MKPKQIIVNADDFGITPGVNQAIVKGHQEGIINSTSLMINLPYTDEAIRLVPSLKNLKIGLHLNLTNEVPVSDSNKIPLLTGENGKFKNGFLSLLLLSLFKPDALEPQLKIEIEAQINKAIKSGIALQHIDGHRHVQSIPLVFKIVKQLAVQYNIPRIRVINENIFYTWKQNKDLSWLFNGNLIKYIVLKILKQINRFDTNVYFYSILYTGKLFKNRVKQLDIPPEYTAVELNFHPSIVEIDKQNSSYIFDEDVLSANRAGEMETVMDKSVL